MVLITGSTGHLGKETINFLLRKIPVNNIAGLARDLAKAESLKKAGVNIRQGDYDDYESLVKAFDGVDKLYFISGSDIAKREAQHINVIKAAKETGVNQVVYTSFQRKTEDGSSPIAFLAKAYINTEKELIFSGLTYTILKHSLYMDALPMFMGEKVIETGRIFLPAGDGKVSFAARTDMAEAASSILTGPGHENKIYEIAGSTSYSFANIAEILSKLSRKKIVYIDAGTETFKQELTKAGVPEDTINFSVSFCQAIKKGEFDFPDPTLEKLLGRKPVTMNDFLKTVYSL